MSVLILAVSLSFYSTIASKHPRFELILLKLLLYGMQMISTLTLYKIMSIFIKIIKIILEETPQDQVKLKINSTNETVQRQVKCNHQKIELDLDIVLSSKVKILNFSLIYEDKNNHQIEGSNAYYFYNLCDALPMQKIKKNVPLKRQLLTDHIQNNKTINMLVGSLCFEYYYRQDVNFIGEIDFMSFRQEQSNDDDNQVQIDEISEIVKVNMNDKTLEIQNCELVSTFSQNKEVNIENILNSSAKTVSRKSILNQQVLNEKRIEKSILETNKNTVQKVLPKMSQINMSKHDIVQVLNCGNVVNQNIKEKEIKLPIFNVQGLDIVGQKNEKQQSKEPQFSIVSSRQQIWTQKNESRHSDQKSNHTQKMMSKHNVEQNLRKTRTQKVPIFKQIPAVESNHINLNNNAEMIDMYFMCCGEQEDPKFTLQQSY